jgi:hypothetical protein
MKWMLFFSLFLTFKVHSLELTKENIEGFSKEYGAVIVNSLERSFGYLSEDLSVETQIGSSVQGLTLFYNKAEYIKLMRNIPKEEWNKLEVETFGFKVMSPLTGEFTVTQYSKFSRSMVWSTYSVGVQGSQIKITKIVDSVN